MDVPEPRYARSGDLNIAYQVVGEGPLDVVMVPTNFSNIELLWELPAPAWFLGRLASVRPHLAEIPGAADAPPRAVGGAALPRRARDDGLSEER